MTYAILCRVMKNNAIQDFFTKGLISKHWFREPKTYWYVQQQRDGQTVYDPQLRFAAGILIVPEVHTARQPGPWNTGLFAQIATGSEAEMQSLRQDTFSFDSNKLFISPIAYETTAEGCVMITQEACGLLVKTGRQMFKILVAQQRIDENKLFNDSRTHLECYLTDKENLLAGKFDTLGFFKENAQTLRFERETGRSKERGGA